MAFGNIATFYLPVAASAGASQWGTDVRKLLDAADAGSDGTSQTNHGTGGNARRTVDPYTVTAADADDSLYGWAITPADMNSVSGATRFFPAGDHVATIRLGHNASTSTGVSLWLSAYHVGAAPTRTRTLLGNVSGGATLPALSGEVTCTATLPLPEVAFGVDETIQYSFEITAAGVAVSGRIVQFFTGTRSAVEAKVVTPGLKTLGDTTGTATGAATASGTSGKVLASVGSAVGAATPSGVAGATSSTTGSAAGVATVAALGSSVAGTTGSAAGVATTSGQVGVIVGTVGTVTVGGGGGGGTTVIKRPILIFDD